MPGTRDGGGAPRGGRGARPHSSWPSPGRGHGATLSEWDRLAAELVPAPAVAHADSDDDFNLAADSDDSGRAERA